MFREHYVYNTYPHPFLIAVIRAGIYAGGLYHEIEADQFTSKETVDLHIALLFAEKDPIGHICETCGKVCRNIGATVYCSCWIPIPGMVSGRWE
jgi:hypothetical protein